MKQTNEFDDLARRKLEERSFPLEAAHWADMERLLAQERRKRRGFYWPLAAGLLLLLGTGLWWQLAQEPTTAPMTQVNEVKVTAPATEEAAPGTVTAPAPATSIAPTTTTEATTATPAAAELRPVATPSEDAPRSTPATPKRNTTAPAPSPKTTGKPVAPTSAPAPSEPTIAPTANPVGPNVPLADVVATPVIAPAIEPAATPPPMEPTAQADPASEPQDSTKAEPPVVGATEPQDTGTTASVEPPIAPVVRSPWELTALGGTLLSTSTYSGGTSASWSEALTGQHAPAFGLEAMRMGRHFGIGTGLHYSTYAERYAQDALYATATNYNDVFFLTPVDTTVLVVTDTIVQGGQVYYVTTPFTLTINVLDQTIDTVYTTVQTQQARDQVNTLSYLEVPLLLDAHTVKGRWHFGVRGGPTIGLLTGRRGSVPDSQMDGLTDYADQPFRSYAFGYVARAYVRFRFCTAWSVGLEPTIRGHFTDAYSDYTMSRRSSGLGAVLSLSYQLR